MIKLTTGLRPGCARGRLCLGVLVASQVRIDNCAVTCDQGSRGLGHSLYCNRYRGEQERIPGGIIG